MLKSIKTRYYVPILQIFLLLFFIVAALLIYQRSVVQFFTSTQAGWLGIILNGVIVMIFLIGIGRMIGMFMAYNREQSILQKFLVHRGGNFLLQVPRQPSCNEIDSLIHQHNIHP